MTTARKLTPRIVGGTDAAIGLDTQDARLRGSGQAPSNPDGPPTEITRVRLAPSRIVPGTRYEIVRWLGEGGMGVVYEARHVDVQRRVALKILRSEYSNNAEATASFRNEARATSNIGSDDILQVYDFAELLDGRLMIAMELLEGHDLRSELPAPLEFGRIIAILRQVCRGLRAAHAAGIIHRDIKPENVFLVRDAGRPDKVKIVDFGIASFARRGGVDEGVTGTPGYLAPETIVEGRVDPPVDQYAVGCLAYELVTGQLPFPQTDIPALLDAHVTQTPALPSSLRAGTPPALDRVIMRCLSKAPGDRFANMSDLEAALCEAQIEASLHSVWDDLPLPDVEADRRDRLLRGMPDPHGFAVRGPSSLALTVAALVLVAIASVTTYLAVRDDVTQARGIGEVEALERDARDAAAKALFVYPPADAPNTNTAYALVRRLERRVGDPWASLRANALRVEFSGTLARLGDEYWSHPHGRGFASGFYEQALLFDPHHAAALERTRVSSDELARLDARATDQSFSDEELVAIEPFLVLAAPDDGQRAQKLEAWRSRRSARNQELDGDLDDVVGPSAPPPRQAEVAASATIDASAPATKATRLDVPVDGATAKALAVQGRGALRGGRIDEARLLFERALARDERNLAALMGLRDIHFDAADYRRAAQYGEQVVALAPKKADHQIRLGDAYYKIKRYADAKRAYEKAAALGAGGAKWRLDKVRALTD